MDYIKTDTGWQPDFTINTEIKAVKTKHKAPKSGRGYGVQGQKYCHGVCSIFEKVRPYIDPYKDHVLCTNCIGTGLNKDGVWQERANLKSNGRCKCCNRLVRQKPKNKAVKIINDTHKRWEAGKDHKKPSGSW